MIKIFLIVATAAFVLSGCPKRPAPPFVYEPEDIEADPDVREGVLIARLDFSRTESTKDLAEKALGKYRDSLEEIKDLNKPLVITVPPHLIQSLGALQERENCLRERILKDPGEISTSDREYFKNKYEINYDTQSILKAQIHQALSILGTRLTDSTTVAYLIQKSTYSIADKEKLLDFMHTEILAFEEILKRVLDKENISEATTSLSDAFLGLLDGERIRTQIMEGIVAYKRFRGVFPGGFVPRGGFINRAAADNIQRTGVKWVFVSIPPDEEINYNTKPRIVDSAALTSVPGAVALLKNGEFKPADVNEYLKDRDIDEEETIELTAAEFIKREWKIRKEAVRKLWGFLEQVGNVISEYRDSGRARIDTLSKIRRSLLVAESGEIADNIEDPFYDRIFRKYLIDIYREIGAGAPGALFLPVSDFKTARSKQLTEADMEEKISEVKWEVGYSTAFVRPVEGVEKIYWGADDSNIYFAFDISTPVVRTAGVYLGHEATPSASLTPRGQNYEIENIVDFPLYIEANWRRQTPGKTVIYRAAGRENWETLSGNFNVEYSGEMLKFAVPLRYLGAGAEDEVYLKFYVNDRGVPEKNFFAMGLPHLRVSDAVLYYIDPAGDAYGPGNYSFPPKYRDLQPNFDLRHVRVNRGSGENIVTVGLSDISLLKSPATDFFNPVIDLYVDINHRIGAGRVDLLEGRKAYTAPEDAWEYAVTVRADYSAVYNMAGRKIGEPQVNINPSNRTVNIFIPDDIIGTSARNWGIIPLVLAETPDGEIAEIKEEDDTGRFITGRRLPSDTNIIDVILPSGYTQREILGANRRGGAVAIPALR